MKGDFTRSTFDARKHYSGVRMQQGRVQLDADWNEQLDIIRHAVESHLRDLLGAAGVPAARAGFGIEVGQRPAGAGDALAPDLLIRSGHYYVDGILCENETPTWLTEQPDNPAAALPSEAADSDSYIVYLDVWQRHITCIEDPDLRELALGGPDTTTRTKTVWQVKLLPIGQDDGAGQPESHDGSLADLPDWKRLVDAAAGKGQLKVRRSTQAQQLRNQLYRVEIHDADPQAPTFKWSRENGSIAFPIVGLTILPAPNAGAPAPTQPADDQTIQFTVVLEYLERDKLYLQRNSWVEIENDDTVLSGRTLPLCRVVRLDLIEGQDDDLGQVRGHVTLEADKQIVADLGSLWPQPGDVAAARRKHPLLRRWDQSDGPGA